MKLGVMDYIVSAGDEAATFKRAKRLGLAGVEVDLLSLTNHTQVVGANGQRQAMFLEKLEGFGEVILRNFVFGSRDSFIVFSNGGVNGAVIDVALGGAPS